MILYALIAWLICLVLGYIFNKPTQTDGKNEESTRQSKSKPVIETVDIKIIGRVESCFKRRFGCPRQDVNGKHSTDGLEGYSHLWLTFLFHTNTNMHKGEIKAKVVPPRSNGKRVGHFACRTPHRPNPLGLTLVKIEKIFPNGDLLISGLDLINDTPIVDIKPYLAVEAVDCTQASWVDQGIHHEFDDVVIADCVNVILDKHSKRSKLYKNDETSLKKAIKQALLIDPRTIFSNKIGSEACDDQHSLHFDGLVLNWRIIDRNGNEQMDWSLSPQGLIAEVFSVGK